MIAALPYPGLRPFQQDEANIFFGREEQIDELLQKLDEHRFVSVIGSSGCGKSSLVRAGMIAALASGFMTHAGSRWRTVSMRPGNAPIRRLGEALIADTALGPERGTSPEAMAFLDASLRRGPLGLLHVLRETPLPEGFKMLLLVDQFEEIFRFRREGSLDEADAFVDLLLATATQTDSGVYVVLTMRSDYIGDCAVFAGLPEMLNRCQYLTPRMSREQRRLAIVGPARVFGGDAEPALVNTLLNEAGTDPANLPILQHLLMRMWTHASSAARQDRNGGRAAIPGAGTGESGGIRLTVRDYEEVGGLSGALQKHADESFALLNEDGRVLAGKMFRALCERRAGGRDIRRPETVRAIAEQAGTTPKQIIAVAEVFRAPDCSFIVPPQPEPLSSASVLDISHESLIRLWTRLANWVAEETASAERFGFLRETARRWKAGEAALWGTPDLDNGLAWKQREQPTPAWAERYGGGFDIAMEFLDASEKEKQRQVERRRAERRRRRWLVRALALSVTLTVWTGYYFLVQKEKDLVIIENRKKTDTLQQQEQLISVYTAGVELTDAGLYSITGSMKRNGAPVPYATVFVLPPDNITETDEDGSFALEQMLRQPYFLVIEGESGELHRFLMDSSAVVRGPDGTEITYRFEQEKK